MNSSSIRPIFIFSLPRSGSTLLQRILASHEKIETAAEPWVLLPFIYPLKWGGVFAEYSHANAVAAIGDFITSLPNGEKDYLEAVNLAAESLYRKAAGSSDAKYFLDKTPRYALICDEVIKAFPDAKFIFLWRNPLAVIASMIETWGQGKWSLYHYKIDLFQGQIRLLDTFERYANIVLSIKYEDFVVGPRKELDRIGNYLDIEFGGDVLESFPSISFEGKMGDPSGSKLYSQVSNEPLNKWKKTLCNPLRKWWCKHYLLWLGNERLEVMGYNFNDLILELDTIPFSTRFLFSDLFRVPLGEGAIFLMRAILKLLRKVLGW